ncbi:hypothetical protein [Fictibacillus terranigra]|uniref:Uncharacterized protein n=1 Tax=Fictibacillus terranigra TaxID=3058424 RepID=A0ABT8EDQ9_9BACL|nr:hypothetical protein [Fictibacillus sp. CENA-BCM004]MDN4076065.1 hypothetical protein [Fictibacillus sp. CENA-BCM004]
MIQSEHAVKTLPHHLEPYWKDFINGLDEDIVQGEEDEEIRALFFTFKYVSVPVRDLYQLM